MHSTDWSTTQTVTKEKKTQSRFTRQAAPRIVPKRFIHSKTGKLAYGQLYSIAESIWICKYQAAAKCKEKSRYMYVDPLEDIAYIIMQGGMCAHIHTAIDDFTGIAEHAVTGCMHIEYKGQWQGYPVAKIGGLAVENARSICALWKTLLFPEFRGAIKIFGTWGKDKRADETKISGGMLFRALRALRQRPDLGIPFITSAEQLDSSLIDVYARRRDGSRKQFDDRDFTIILPPGMPRYLWPKKVQETPEAYPQLVHYLTESSLTPQDKGNIARWLLDVERSHRLLDGIKWNVPAPDGPGSSMEYLTDSTENCHAA